MEVVNQPEATFQMNPRTSILSVINDNSTRSVEIGDELSEKVSNIDKQVKLLTEQIDENHTLILKLFQEMQAPPSVKARKAPVTK
jgi:hypothetical protein